MGHSKPNIVLVIVHDLGQHLGCYGIPTVVSPNCDALAANGVRFSNSFAVAPQCSPSRAALFTGRYPHENGMIGLAHDPHGWDIHDDEIHLARYLRDAGYHTGLIGFQHETRRPAEMGFDECDYRWHDSCENISRDAAGFIRAHRNDRDPYYLQVGMIEPHRRFDMYGGQPDDSRGVWVPPYLEDESSATEDFAAFQGAIRKMDASFGVLMSAVESAGTRENTLIIFTTDHGIPFPRAKCSLYDPGLQTALIAQWPAGGYSGGQVVDGLISNVDLMPTLLEVAGVPIPSGVSGESFAGLSSRRTRLFGEMSWHSYYDPMRCVRDDRFKLIANFSAAPFIHDPSQAWRPLTSPLPPRARIGLHPDFEFYDLRADPSELNNLYESGAQATVRDRLLVSLARWCIETGDQLLARPPVNPQHQRVMQLLLSSLESASPSGSV